VIIADLVCSQCLQSKHPFCFNSKPFIRHPSGVLLVKAAPRSSCTSRADCEAFMHVAFTRPSLMRVITRAPVGSGATQQQVPRFATCQPHSHHPRRRAAEPTIVSPMAQHVEGRRCVAEVVVKIYDAPILTPLPIPVTAMHATDRKSGMKA
jgi:hypothetical protein